MNTQNPSQSPQLAGGFFNIAPSATKIALLVLAVGTVWASQIYVRSSPVAMLEVSPTAVSSLGQDVEASGILNGESKAQHASGESIRKLNMNKATAQEFETLPGVGPELAEAIIRFRDDHGDFQALEQLKQVRGIGEKRFATLSRFLTLEGGAEEIQVQVPPSEE